MGKLEVDMTRYKKMPATRYVTYVAKSEEDRLHFAATLQIYIDAMEVPGTKSGFLGRGNAKLPQNLRVTVEWDDTPDFEETALNP